MGESRRSPLDRLVISFEVQERDRHAAFGGEILRIERVQVQRAGQLVNRGFMLSEQHAGPSAALPSDRQILVNREPSIDQGYTRFVVAADICQGVP